MSSTGGDTARNSFTISRALAAAATLSATVAAAQPFDDARYPDLKDQWIRVGEFSCAEHNDHARIGGEAYFLSADGLLMPTRKDQPPPDLRYFKGSGGSHP